MARSVSHAPAAEPLGLASATSFQHVRLVECLSRVVRACRRYNGSSMRSCLCATGGFSSGLRPHVIARRTRKPSGPNTGPELHQFVADVAKSAEPQLAFSKNCPILRNFS